MSEQTIAFAIAWAALFMALCAALLYVTDPERDRHRNPPTY